LEPDSLFPVAGFCLSPQSSICARLCLRHVGLRLLRRPSHAALREFHRRIREHDCLLHRLQYLYQSISLGILGDRHRVFPPLHLCHYVLLSAIANYYYSPLLSSQFCFIAADVAITAPKFDSRPFISAFGHQTVIPLISFSHVADPTAIELAADLVDAVTVQAIDLSDVGAKFGSRALAEALKKKPSEL
jgi:hypothetical protein